MATICAFRRFISETFSNFALVANSALQAYIMKLQEFTWHKKPRKLLINKVLWRGYKEFNSNLSHDLNSFQYVPIQPRLYPLQLNADVL